jgi:hypothetical protein
MAPIPARLAWEGSLAALRALTEAGWPAMRDSKGLMEWAVDEWVGHGALLIDHLERDPDLAPDDPALRRDLALYETHREGDDGRWGDGVAAYARRWLRWLKPAPDLPAVSSVLEQLGREDDKLAFEHATDLAASLAARLRTERGWTRSQGWVLVALREVPEEQRDEPDRRWLAFAEGEGRERGTWLVA